MKEFIENHYKKNKNFVTYTYVGIIISILNIILLWLFIDIFKISTLISSTVIVFGLFVLKFFMYKKTGFTQ